MPHTSDDPAVVVLVAEDETLVRLFANDILTDAGYRVLEARDGQEALTILQVHPDVRALLTDVTMPNLDGLSLARIVSERWPHVGIVITSALGLPSEPPQGARVVHKPYKPEDMLREIEAAIEETSLEVDTAPVALKSIPTMQAGKMHGAGGLAQPLSKPDE